MDEPAEGRSSKPRMGDEDGQRWRPPQVGWVMLNTDAGFCPNSGRASTGIVVHGPSGEILLTAWRSIRACGSSEEAEAEACLQGVRLVGQWIKQPTHIELDCQTLVKKVVALALLQKRFVVSAVKSFFVLISSADTLLRI
jgi:hypothetical protein